MREVFAGFHKRCHVFNFDQFLKARVIVTFELAKAHCESGFIFKTNFHLPFLDSGAIDQAALSIIPEKLSFCEINCHNNLFQLLMAEGLMHFLSNHLLHHLHFLNAHFPLEPLLKSFIEDDRALHVGIKCIHSYFI